jgi:CSLREA domain-containing protein
MSVRSLKRLSVEPLEGREMPATFTVTTVADVVDPNDGRLSLREAISRANTTPGADTVRLPAGVFGLALPGGEDQNAAGDFDVTDSLTVTGVGAGATVIDGHHLDGLFDVHGPIDVTFNGLTLRNGSGAQAGGAIQSPIGNVTLNNVVAIRNVAVNGGAIDAGSGTLTIRNSRLTTNTADGGIGGAVHLGGGRLLLDGSTVTNNFAVGGGGIFAAGGTVTLSGSAVTFNVSGASGGGIAAQGGLVSLTRSSVRGNLAGGDGGGISASTVILTGSSVTGNRSSDDGGGIGAQSATLVGSTVDGNAAEDTGGGLACTTATLTASTVSHNTSGSIGGGISAQETVTLVRSTVSGNTAGSGGGGISADTANLINATVSGNTAELGATLFGYNGFGGGGGGILATHGTIRNSTIVENRTFADTGGGVSSPASAEPIRVQNTIIAGNFNRSFTQDVAGTFASEGNNLVGEVDGDSQGFSPAIDLVGTDEAPLDPRLGELAFNGGPTKTHALLADSPAIDHGSNLGAPAIDQRGFRRVKDGNGDSRLVIHIGAVER